MTIELVPLLPSCFSSDDAIPAARPFSLLSKPADHKTRLLSFALGLNAGKLGPCSPGVVPFLVVWILALRGSE